MKYTILAAIALIGLACSSHSQTIKSLGYNTTNGQIVYSGTNPMTFTNSVTFSQLSVSNGAITNPAIRFGFAGTGFSASEGPSTLRTMVGGSQLLSLFGGGFTVTPAATFSTNVTINGNLSVGSADVESGSFSEFRLTLPDNANVIRITSGTPIHRIGNGRLGAFYYLINTTTNAVVIHSGNGITIQGGTSLTLGANQAATLVATGATNASVAARGDLNDVTLGGTLNLAPAQTAASASSLMTRGLGDARYGEWVSQTEMGMLSFSATTTVQTFQGGSAQSGVTNDLIGHVLRMRGFTNTNDFNVVNVLAASLLFANSGGVAIQGQGVGLYVRAGVGLGVNRVARIIYGGVSSNQVAGIVGTNGIDRRGFALEIFNTTNSATNNLRLVAQDGTNGTIESATIPVAAGSTAGSFFMVHRDNATRVYYASDNNRPSKTPVITLNHVFAAGSSPTGNQGIAFAVVNTNTNTVAGNMFIRGAWQIINAHLVGY